MDEQDLCLAIAVYADSHKVTTVPLFVSALADYTRRTFGTDLPRGTLYEQVIRGLTNYYGDTNVSAPKSALTTADLRAFSQLLDTRYFEHARDWCACLIAFFGLLRISEYMNSGLRMQHVCSTLEGVEVTVLRSKTSHVKTTIALASRPDGLCPKKALTDYLSFFPVLRLPQHPDDPLFVTRLHDGHSVQPMTADEFIARVRDLVRTAFPNREPSLYAGHSFRRGGASALQLAGVPAAMIQRHGRWASDAYRGYLDSANSSDMRLLATRSLLPSSDQSRTSPGPVRRRRTPAPPVGGGGVSSSLPVGFTSTSISIGTPHTH